MEKILKAIGQKVANKLEWLVFKQRHLERQVTLRDEDLVFQTESSLYVSRKGFVYRIKPDFEGFYPQNPTVVLKYMGETRIRSLKQFQTYGSLRSVSN